jgi:hypothetical protein
MDNYQEFDELVKNSIERAIDSGAHVEEPPDDDLKGDMNGFFEWMGQLIDHYQLKPGIRIFKPNAYLMCAQYHHNQHPLFFFANVHQSKFISSRVAHMGREFDYWRWYPENNTREKLIPDEEGAFQLDLKPLESAMIVLEHSDSNAKSPEIIIRRNEWVLEGKWELECIPKIKGETVVKTLNNLTDVSAFPELSDFSGTMIYTKSFVLEDPDYFEMELGKVYDLAEVFVNGKSIGVDWFGHKTFSLDGYLIKGKNELEIRVVNTLLNYCLAHRDNPEIGYWLERYRDQATPSPAGLLGPVKMFG